MAFFIDEVTIQAKLQSSFNGTRHWTDVNTRVFHKNGNLFTAHTFFGYIVQGHPCKIDVELVFRVYENGFLLKNYQPRRLDFTHSCHRYAYSWFRQEKPYLRR